MPFPAITLKEFSGLSRPRQRRQLTVDTSQRLDDSLFMMFALM